jgi:hypothetical protein
VGGPFGNNANVPGIALNTPPAFNFKFSFEDVERLILAMVYMLGRSMVRRDDALGKGIPSSGIVTDCFIVEENASDFRRIPSPA